MKRAKKFLLNAAILTLVSLIIRTAHVSFTVYLSQKIGAEGMGIFQLMLSIYIFAVTLSTSGVSLATTRLVAEELACHMQSGVRASMKRCIVYGLTCSSLACALFFIAAPWIASKWLHGKVSVYPLYVLACSLPFLTISSIFSGYFIAVRRVIKSASEGLIEQFLRISVTIYLLTILLPKGLSGSLLAITIGGTISEIISCFYLLILYRLDVHRYKDDAIAHPHLTRKMFGIAVPVALSSYIRSALNTYKQIMIPAGLERSGMGCDVAIAQYGMIRGMVMPILMFPSAILSAFSSLLVPEIAEIHVQENRARIENIVARMIKITLLFSIGISGILLAFSSEISLSIYKNLDTAALLKIFAPLVVIMYLDGIVDAILKGLNEQVSVVKINVFDMVLSIALLYALLPLHGINGYIIVLYISELTNGILSINRLVQLRYFKVQWVRWVFLPILVITVSVLASKSIKIENTWISIAIAAIVYACILYALGVVTKKDIKI